MASFELDQAERAAQMRTNWHAYGANVIRLCLAISFSRVFSIVDSSLCRVDVFVSSVFDFFTIEFFWFIRVLSWHRLGNGIRSWNSITRRKCVWKIRTPSYTRRIAFKCFRPVINDSDQRMSTSYEMLHWNVGINAICSSTWCPNGLPHRVIATVQVICHRNVNWISAKWYWLSSVCKNSPLIYELGEDWNIVLAKDEIFSDPFCLRTWNWDNATKARLFTLIPKTNNNRLCIHDAKNGLVHINVYLVGNMKLRLMLLLLAISVANAIPPFSVDRFVLSLLEFDLI